LAFDAAVLWLAVRRLLKVEDSCIHVLSAAFSCFGLRLEGPETLGKCPNRRAIPWSSYSGTGV